MKETEVRSRWIITGIVFAVCVVVLAVLMRGVRRNTLDQLREVCRLNEQASVNELNENISGCKDITETLDLLLQEGGNGEIHEFDSLCRKIMAGKNEVACLQLARNGIVTQTFPEGSRYSDQKYLFESAETREICEYSKNTGAIVIQGPVEMNHGDPVVIVRDPVYLTGEDGKKRFWGFTIALIRSSKAFQSAMNSLGSFGYDYNLYKTEPLDTDYHLLNTSGQSLEKPVEVTFINGYCSWKLEVEPKKGWDVTEHLILYYCFGMAVSILITVMVYMMLRISGDRRRFVYMSEHDELTSLLNVRKFSADAEEISAQNGLNGCGFGILYIDINCFKAINDNYGHETGDDVLVETARRISAAVPYSCYRLGGDELGVLVTEDLTEDGYREIIRQVNAYFKEPVCSGDRCIPVSLSIGYALSSVNGTDVEKLRQAADQRMYCEKQKYHEKRERRETKEYREKKEDREPQDNGMSDTGRIES